MVNHPNRSKQQHTQHTPGPWTMKRGEGRYSDRLYIESHVYSTPTVTSGKDQIVQLTSLKWDDHGQEVEANARLIAAAPELLAALKLILEGTQCQDLADDEARKHNAFEARAAIAKAEARIP